MTEQLKLKKIAFFKPGDINLVGGGERVLVQISNYLAKEYDVTIITYSSTNSFYKIDEKVKILPLGLKKSRISFIRIFQPFFFLRKLSEIIEENDIKDIIAFSDIGAYFVFISFLFNTKIKKYIWLHNSYFQPINKIIKISRLFVYRNFDKLIVLNKMDEAIYKQKIGQNKVIRIINPLAFHLKSGSSLTNKKIISIGRFHEEKGYLFLIETAKIIFKERPDWKLQIFGQDRGQEDKIRLLITKYNLNDHISIRQPIEKIEKEYLDSSIYVMTSLYECLPLVLLEASEANLPLVAFNSPGGISDIIVDNKNGYLVPQFDIDVFANRIIKLIDSFELRKRMGDQAKEMAKSYRIDNVIAQWQNLLKN